MTDKEKIEEMTSIINDEKDVCVRMQGLMDCKYCTCKNENGECGFAEYISRTFFAEGYRKESETAKEILQPIYELCKVRNNNIQWDDVYFLAYRYGVEID